MKRRTPWWAVVLVVLIGAGVGVYGGLYMTKVRDGMLATGTGFTDMLKPPFEGKRYATILMIGVDNTGSKKIDDASGLSDTLVVFAVDTKTKEIRGISIPRDTKVEIPGHKSGKINSAHALGGPELTMQTVSQLLNHPIDHYVKTTVSGLVKLVDMVGGVYIKVDKNMRYTDRRGGLYINLKASPEKQLLDGKQAMGYVRFRHDAVGDYGFKIEDGKKVPVGRVVRQQYFFRSLANRVLAMPHKSQRMDFLTKALNRKYLVSSLNMNDWNGLMDAAKDFDPETIVMDVLPSVPSTIRKVSYVIPDTEAIPALVAKNLKFEDLNTAEGATSGATPTPSVPVTPITIQVLNGSKKAGLAKTVGEHLMRSGYKVVYVGNAPSTSSSACEILCKSNNDQVASLAQLLGCRQVRTSTELSNADVTVILGKGFNTKLVSGARG